MTSEDYIIQLRDELKKLGGMRPLGEEYIRITGQTAPAGGVDYVGQTATRAMYVDLWAWVQENKPDSIISEDEWQAMYAANNGNVPYWSTGDGSTTFRFPRMVGYPKFAGSVEDVGKFVKEGLPNITGSFIVTDNVATNGDGTTPKVRWGEGALQTSESGARNTVNINTNISVVSGTKIDKVILDASNSNPTYGNSDHVTPETVCIIAGVIAFGVPSAVGQADKEGILAELELHGTEIERITSRQIPEALSAAIPVGAVMPFASNPVPDGWLICGGAAVSRTTYADLFAAIGTTYGAGDGSTTFNLPYLIDRFIEGSGTSGSYKGPGLPNATGTFRSFSGYSGGAFFQGNPFTMEDPGSSGESYANVVIEMWLSASNAIYGASDTVQPPALTMRYFIKY